MVTEMINDETLRDRIKSVARELFRTKGFEETSVVDVLERLQISEQLFYSTFSSMDDLLEAVWSES